MRSCGPKAIPKEAWHVGRQVIYSHSIAELAGRVCDQAINKTFIKNQFRKSTIIKMPFFKRHKCSIDFSKSAVVIARQELACVNEFGRLLVGNV